MFKKILVPVDFTAKNEAAIEATSEIAKMNHAEITLFHAIEKIDLLTSSEVRGFYSRLKKNAETKIRTLAKKFNSKIKVKTNIIFGNRAEEIVRFALDHDIDLIVMASHKINQRNMNEGWGTLSYKVAILSQCPVLLVK
ncbi:MAG TPA: universal stress protein [Acidobacteriota bacterium]|jgi:universal stress protein A|nr:universal stress protein [Acidobacteriota bacterium]